MISPICLEITMRKKHQRENITQLRISKKTSSLFEEVISCKKSRNLLSKNHSTHKTMRYAYTTLSRWEVVVKSYSERSKMFQVNTKAMRTQSEGIATIYTKNICPLMASTSKCTRLDHIICMLRQGSLLLWTELSFVIRRANSLDFLSS